MGIWPWVTWAFCALCTPSASHAQSRSASDPAVGTAEIIVTGRRPRIIAEKDVAETIPPDVIKIYATDSIGELLGRLSARFGSNFSIVVNGRRLASNDAINALPPEALQQIQVLTPIKAREFGFPTAQTVINLELRPKFQFLAAEGNGSMATDGAGDAETSTLRYSRIRNDQRLTAALTLLHQGGIRQRDRFRSTAPQDDRSLIPSQDAITFTGGYGRPLGALNLDFSADAGMTRSETLAGVVAAASGTNDYQATHQENSIRFLRASTTLGGQIGSYFLSLQVNGEQSWTTIRNLAGNKHTSPDLHSASASFSGTLTASGTLFQVPAGPVTIDGSLGGTTSDITVRQGNAAGQQNSPRYSSLSGQAGITLPITRKGQGMLGAIGDLSVGGRLDYSQASAFGQSIAVTSTLDWTVFEGLRAQNLKFKAILPFRLNVQVRAIARIMWDQGQENDHHQWRFSPIGNAPSISDQ